MAPSRSWAQRALSASLLLHLLLSTQAPATANASVSQFTQCRRIGRTLQLLSALVDFYTTDPDDINADGYFGLSLSHDVLKAVQLEPTCPELQPALRSVMARQQMLAQRWERRLAGKSEYDSVTYNRICRPLSELLRQLIGILRHSRLEVRPASSGSSTISAGENLSDRLDLMRQMFSYQEDSGDVCLTEALQSGVGCPESRVCTYFDQPLEQATGYYLTHQLVYKTIRAATGCQSSGARAAINPVSIPEELTGMCAKALAEFQLIQRANWTGVALRARDAAVTALRDLYIEQGLLCGLLGIRSFYDRQSVETVASWQDPDTGCFKFFRSAEQPGAAAVSSSSSGFRRILRDAEMLGGCSAHSSGIAMGYYSNAIRFLANQ